MNLEVVLKIVLKMLNNLMDDKKGKKKNDEYRICVDFRALNSEIIKDRYPLSHIWYFLKYLRTSLQSQKLQMDITDIWRFQRLINKVLENLRFEKALAYMDEVLLPSSTFEEFTEVLRLVLTEFRKDALTLRLYKCHFYG